MNLAEYPEHGHALKSGAFGFIPVGARFQGIGLAAAAVLGAGASMFSSSQQADATQNAANTAARSQRDANQLNYKQFLESRGSGGSAVLPTYLQLTGGGGLFEGALGNDLVNAYQQSSVPLSTFQGAANRLAPAQRGAEDFTNQIFNGGVTNRLLSDAAPVQAAKLAYAKSTSMDALNRTLAAIDAAQAGKGFTGDSLASRMVGLGAQKSAGDAISTASLSNMGENQQIRNYGDVSLPMQNLNLPYQMAQQAGNYAFLPQNDWLQSLQSRMSPLSFLRIGTASPFQFQTLPTAPPIPSTGGLIGQGIGQLGGTAAQYFMGQQAQQNLMGQMPYYNGAGYSMNTGNAVGNSIAAGQVNDPYFTSGAAAAGANVAAGGGGSAAVDLLGSGTGPGIMAGGGY